MKAYLHTREEERREERYERCIHVYVRRENAPEAGVEVRLRLPGRCHCHWGSVAGKQILERRALERWVVRILSASVATCIVSPDQSGDEGLL